jgi:membrane protein YqaA with SNARE-associated domain
MDYQTQEIKDQARRWVYERLAFVSAAIWAVGTAILFFFTVPYVEHPQPYIAVAMLTPVLPAAIPWLFYHRISDAVARRWMARRSD